MHNRRHHLIILGSYQRRIIAGAVMTAILLINVILVSWFLLDPTLIGRIDTVDTLIIAGVEMAVIGLIFVLSLVASNKIAGPIYAFEKVLKQVRAGDLSARLHLRPGDICHSVADEMNVTFEELNERVEAIKVSIEKLNAAEGDPGRQQALIDELQEQLGHFNNQGGEE